MKKYRVIAFIFSIILLFSNVCVSYAVNVTEKNEETEQEKIEAKSPYAILVDLNSGIVLYQKNANDTVYPAALTNIMTAVLVLENCNLEELATASETALSNVMSGDSKIGILKDEKLSVRQLLYGMMLESASDAANVLAEKTFGSIEEFVKQMNKRAGELGMKNTNFTNPTGNHDERHYTTAADMAVLSRYAMSIPEFRDIIKCDSYSIPPTEKNQNTRKAVNRNHLVSRLVRNDYYYSYATGMKSAYSAEAKSCLAATATRKSVSVLALVFGATTENNIAQSYADCREMFDFVFRNYITQQIVEEGDIVAQTQLENARRENKVILKVSEGVSVLRRKDSEALEVSYKDHFSKAVSAPVEKDKKVGTREYYMNNELIATVDLLSDKDYKLDPVTYLVNKVVAFVTSPWLYAVIILLLLLIVLAERRRRRILRKKKRDARKKRNKELVRSIERK